MLPSSYARFVCNIRLHRENCLSPLTSYCGRLYFCEDAAVPAQRTQPSKELSKERRRMGRPPAGARPGEKVKDYPQLSVRLPIEIKAKLDALSSISARPQWRLIVDA